MKGERVPAATGAVAPQRRDGRLRRRGSPSRSEIAIHLAERWAAAPQGLAIALGPRDPPCGEMGGCAHGFGDARGAKGRRLYFIASLAVQLGEWLTYLCSNSLSNSAAKLSICTMSPRMLVRMKL